MEEGHSDPPRGSDCETIKGPYLTNNPSSSNPESDLSGFHITLVSR